VKENFPFVLLGLFVGFFLGLYADTDFASTFGFQKDKEGWFYAYQTFIASVTAIVGAYYLTYRPLVDQRNDEQKVQIAIAGAKIKDFYDASTKGLSQLKKNKEKGSEEYNNVQMYQDFKGFFSNLGSVRPEIEKLMLSHISFLEIEKLLNDFKTVFDVFEAIDSSCPETSILTLSLSKLSEQSKANTDKIEEILKNFCKEYERIFGKN